VSQSRGERGRLSLISLEEVREERYGDIPRGGQSRVGRVCFLPNLGGSGRCSRGSPQRSDQRHTGNIPTRLRDISGSKRQRGRGRGGVERETETEADLLSADKAVTI
jgi:hypothetical protein